MIKHINLKLQTAKLVLVGLGEDFDFEKTVKSDERFIHFSESNIDKWTLPFIERAIIQERKEEMAKTYEYLEKILKGKNYFVVSTCIDDLIDYTELREERIVKPCGGFSKLQCEKKCTNEMYDIPMSIENTFSSLIDNKEFELKINRPVCPHCGEPLVFNNIKTENYIEDSYLDNWKTYMQWLQGTINKELCIIELGAGLKYPSVIRWPFEKIVFFNEKAEMFRVHERLYQITDEIKDRGYGICHKTIDFLKELSMEC